MDSGAGIFQENEKSSLTQEENEQLENIESEKEEENGFSLDEIRPSLVEGNHLGIARLAFGISNTVCVDEEKGIFAIFDIRTKLWKFQSADSSILFHMESVMNQLYPQTSIPYSLRKDIPVFFKNLDHFSKAFSLLKSMKFVPDFINVLNSKTETLVPLNDGKVYDRTKGEVRDRVAADLFTRTTTIEFIKGCDIPPFAKQILPQIEKKVTTNLLTRIMNREVRDVLLVKFDIKNDSHLKFMKSLSKTLSVEMSMMDLASFNKLTQENRPPTLICVHSENVLSDWNQGDVLVFNKGVSGDMEMDMNLLFSWILEKK